jgi:hypothetical protein
MNTPTTAPTTTQAPTTLPSTPPSLPPAEPSTTPIIPETLNISLADLNKLRGQEQASQIKTKFFRRERINFTRCSG